MYFGKIEAKILMNFQLQAEKRREEEKSSVLFFVRAGFLNED